jgi:TolA-binding protein
MLDKQEPQRKKIGAWIAPELYNKIESLGYKTWTEAIIRGLDLLVLEYETGQDGATPGKSGAQTGQDEARHGMGGATPSNQSDSVELGQLQAKVGQMENHIETLKSSLDQANKDKEDLKEMYTNHVLQVQTLINKLEDKKQIEAPTVEKKKPFWKFW